jgi:hypothetical protein
LRTEADDAALTSRDSEQYTDSDAVYAGFIATCQISPERCPLASYAQGKDRSLSRIIKQLLKDLRLRPLSLGPSALPQYVDYGTVKSFIVGALYTPATWPTLASFLRQILDRNGSELAAVTQSMVATGTAAFPENLALETLQAIRCGDNAFRTDNLNDVLPLVENFYEQSAISGDFWTVQQPLFCAQWPFHAKEIYSGSFENISTRHPILFIGNTFDPVTPLVSARNASSSFVGSQVLVQNGYGHSSLAQPSTCTTRHIQQYFTNGTLPVPGTVCETIAAPFSLELEEAGNSSPNRRRWLL